MGSYRYGEGRTITGQMVEFSCPVDDVEQVSEFLRTHVRRIDIPTTGRVNVPHGGYGQYTRYEIVQHRYAGGGYDGNCGYIEVLEIKNSPDERWGIVINEYTSRNGSVFTEWESVEDARSAFEKFWGSHETAEKFPELPGFKRRVICSALTPWFYAIGDEELLGDYAFPEGLQDDSVYRFGRQFVVFDKDDVPEIKTCMGTRFVSGKRDRHPYDEYHYRLVYWDDGSVWDESMNRSSSPPRPVEEGEMWITEAVQQFKQLLAGRNTRFEIDFTNGNKFIGRLIETKPRTPRVEGNYLVVIRLKGERKSRKGWVDFKPSIEAPDIVKYVTQAYAKLGQEVEYVRIEDSDTKKGGRKWSGAFFHLSSNEE